MHGAMVKENGVMAFKNGQPWVLLACFEYRIMIIDTPAPLCFPNRNLMVICSSQMNDAQSMP